MIGTVSVALIIFALVLLPPLFESAKTFTARTRASGYVCWSVSFTVDGKEVVVDEEGRLGYLQCPESEERSTELGRCTSGIAAIVRHTTSPPPEAPSSTLIVEILEDGQVVKTETLDAQGPRTQFVRLAC